MHKQAEEQVAATKQHWMAEKEAARRKAEEEEEARRKAEEHAALHRKAAEEVAKQHWGREVGNAMDIARVRWVIQRILLEVGGV